VGPSGTNTACSQGKVMPCGCEIAASESSGIGPMATDDFLHAPRQQAHGLTAHLAQRPHHSGPGPRARPGAPAVPSVGSAGHRPEARSANAPARGRFMPRNLTVAAAHSDLPSTFNCRLRGAGKVMRRNDSTRLQHRQEAV
jgi:hypothetical protein